MKSIASCSFRTKLCWSWAKSTTARTNRSSSRKKSCRSKTLPVVTPNRSTCASTPPASRPNYSKPPASWPPPIRAIARRRVIRRRHLLRESGPQPARARPTCLGAKRQRGFGQRDRLKSRRSSSGPAKPFVVSPQERLLFRQQGLAVPERGAPGHQFAEFFVVLAGEEERGPFAQAAEVLPGRFERGLGGFFAPAPAQFDAQRSEEHTSELQSRLHLVCRLLLEKKKKN